MKLHIVPAKTGLQWVRLGLQTFWRQPMALTALLFISMMAVSLIGLFPLIGSYLALVLMPTVFLVMMLGAAETHQGRMPRPSLAFTPFRQGKARVQALAILGLFYAAGILLIVTLTSMFDDGSLAQLSLSNDPMTPELAEELVQQPGFHVALWSGLILYNLLALLMWHAPALVHWHGVSPVKAVFFSVVACARNFRAFALYMLGWFGLMIGAGIAISLLTTVVYAVMGTSTRFVVNILTIMLGMGLITAVLTSAVFTFRDCFSPPDGNHDLQSDE